MLRHAVITAIIATQAGAQEQCVPQEPLEQHLQDEYGVTLQVAGLTGNGQQLMQMFANLQTGFWAATVSNAAGVSCIVAVGNHYVVFELPPPNNGPQP